MSNKLKVFLSACFFLVIFLFIFFVLNQMKSINNSVIGLTDTVLKIQNKLSDREKSNSFSDQDKLVSAVSSAIEKINEEKINKAKNELYKEFDLAPKNSEKHIYGNPNARFTMIEFSDLECPYCRRFHDTPKKIVDLNKDSINWEFKHKPLDMHGAAAKKEAMASECVSDQLGNRGFWVFVNSVFDQTHGNGEGVSDLKSIVKSIGGDLNEFESCMNSGKNILKVESDSKTADKYGISGTPATVIVDNKTGRKMLVRGAVPLNNMMAAIQKLVTSNFKNPN